jgi:RES domain-containing protein
LPRRRPTPPPPRRGTQPTETHGVLELERFSDENLARWNALSKDLDQLHAALYFGVLPERRRVREELLDALRSTPLLDMPLQRWTRVITFQYSDEPLSAAGSLHGYGGRFNPGTDLDPDTLNPWPALYVAEDPETALREKFQMAANDKVEGLSRDELALTSATSYASVTLSGHLHRVFDLTTPSHLTAVAKVLARIKMPAIVRQIQRRLGIAHRDMRMVTTARQLYAAVLTNNWRQKPVQFGLPASSHILAELIRAADVEAILYRSTKAPGRCLAVFPDQLTSDSFIELADTAPSGVQHRRLDIDSADTLAGWESLPKQTRPR